MNKLLAGGIELDDDRARVDVRAVHQYLSQETYWAAGRSLETVQALIDSASRVVALYAGDRTIGFARAVSDNFTVAYLADVFVLPEFRGRGLGAELVRAMVDEGPLAHLHWMLRTSAAHGLYAKFGFATNSPLVMERQARS